METERKFWRITVLVQYGTKCEKYWEVVEAPSGLEAFEYLQSRMYQYSGANYCILLGEREATEEEIQVYKDDMEYIIEEGLS